MRRATPPRRRSHRTGWLRLLVILAACAALALPAACAVGPSSRPPVATHDDSPPAPGGPGGGDGASPPPPPLLPPLVAAPTDAIPFIDCTAALRSAGGGAGGARDLRFGCGTVPTSGRGEAGSGQIGIVRITRGPAPATAAPIAVVGEANGPTGAQAALGMAQRAPNALLDGTALYGIDLRGTGNSDPLDCVTASARSAMVDADPTAVDPRGLERLRGAAAVAARTCAQILENGLTDYRTRIGGEDLEQVRVALGVEKLHAIGVGEGAGVVMAWAERHPGSVGRTVLDNPAGPATTSSQRASEQTTGARAALTAFALDCTSRPGCALGPDPVRAVGDVLAGLHTTPLRTLTGRPVTDGTATAALVAGVSQPSQWPATATAMAAARQGDPAGLLALLSPPNPTTGDTHSPVTPGSVSDTLDAGLALSCNDSTERLTVDQVGQQAARARTGDPIFGAYFAQQALRCSAWPVPPATGAPATEPGPPPLMIGTAGDPSTPLGGTQRAANAMPSTVLVTWLGSGHGAYPATPCVTDAVDGYLLRGTLPRSGTVCPP